MEVDELPEGAREERRGQVRREAASRARVLGDAWTENLRALYPDGERPDLVCFTGDVADWGLASEYAKATEFVDEFVRTLGIERSQVYVVPGNHDVQRYVSQNEWAAMRELLRTDARATSEWLAGDKPPRAVEAGVADAMMQRTATFWRWVEHGLGRPELIPAKPLHPRLGYHHVATLPRRLPFDVHVIGLDSAWLAGDDHDQGKLWLTERQCDMLLHDERGHPWKGFRLALVHHPLQELADAQAAQRGLARSADLLLHGHQHDPAGSSLVDLDGDTLRVLAAGCLYEGTEGSAWKNGCQRVDVVLDERGRPLRAEIHFRAWSSRGHWHSDSSLYRGLRDGRRIWDAWDDGRSEMTSRYPGIRVEVDPTPDTTVVRLQDNPLEPYIDALSIYLRAHLPAPLSERHVDRPTSRETSRTSMEELLDLDATGAIITGPTGVGKSTLARQMATLALDRLKSADSQARVPVLVTIADAVASERTPLNYARERVSAHIPALRNEEAFERVLLADGRLLLLLDGYDRCPEGARFALNASIRAFESDYPRCRVLMFSRVAPHAFSSWQRYGLDWFSQEEIFDLISMFDNTNGGGGDELAALFYRNEHWKALLRWPYFLHKLMRHFERHHDTPTSVSSLMDDWLVEVLGSGSLTRAETHRDLLVRIASATRNGPVQVSSFADESAVDIDKLLATGLLVSRGTLVELEHEILGDYLRASTVQLPEDESQMREALVALGFERDGRDSGILLFLSERLGTWPLQRSFWSALCSLDLAAYHRALRAGSPAWPREQSDKGRKGFLEELWAGYDQLVHRWFSEFRSISVGRYRAPISTGRSGLAGYVDASYEGVRYRYTRGDALRGVAFTTRNHKRHSNLRGPHATVSSPRQLAIRDLQSEIKKRLDEGLLGGETIWTQERVSACLSTIEGGCNLPLHRIRDGLRDGHLDGPDDLLVNIESLIAEGFTSAHEWALPSGDRSTEEMTHAYLPTDLYSNQRLHEYIERLYERVLLAYDEVIRTSFPELAGTRIWNSAFPVVLNLDVERQASPAPMAQIGIDMWWEPLDKGPSQPRVRLGHGPRDFDFGAEMTRVGDLLRTFGRPAVVPWYSGEIFHIGRRGALTEVSARVVDLVRADISTAFGGHIPFW